LGHRQITEAAMSEKVLDESHRLREVAIGVGAALATLAAWTAWIVATRAAVGASGYFSPMLLILIRFGLSALMLAPVLWRMGVLPRGLGWPRRLGLLMSGSPYVLLVGMGMKHAPVADVGPLLPGTMPLFVAILSALVYGERFSRARRFGMVLVALGIVLILIGGHRSDTDHLALGQLLILTGALCWAIYTISLRNSGLMGVEAIAYVAFWSLVLALPFALPGLPADLARAAQAPVSQWIMQICIQGLFAGLLAMLTYTLAVRCLGPSRSAALTGLTPVTAMLAGWAFLHETPAPAQILAGLVIVFGVLLSTGAIVVRRRRVAF
jgi:drug/metabolite transporter (DMT)-like permease